MKFVYYNDTGRKISVHPATESYGIKCDMAVIKPLEDMPSNTYPGVKIWDYGEKRGLSILVSAQKDED